MAINLTYKGLTGLRRTLTGFDETTTIDNLIATIAADEELDTNYYVISKEGDPTNTNSLDYSDSSATVASVGIVSGDVIICKPNTLGTTKQTRQVMKLDIAQKKREGGPDDDDTAVYYRSNNVYDLTSLPDTYNDNLPGADDNPNTEGLLPKRPWIAVGAIAAPTSITESVGGDSLVDLEIWYDGSDTSSIVPTGIADEENINQWNDKSGLAHNLNFDGGNNKPSYESSDTQNGYGYVQFADGDLMSINPLASLSGATAFTVFVIARSTDLSTNATQILTSTENGELSIQIDSNGEARFKVGGSSATTTTQPVGLNEWNIYTLVYNATNNIVGRVNDGKLPSQTIVSAGAVAGPATLGASTYLYVGGDNTGGTFIGDVGEVIIFKKALNATEYANVENYLATKWGV